MPNRLKRRNSGSGHSYTIDGQYTPGVTTVLGTLDKPWMKPWVSGLIADYVADHRDWLAEAPDTDTIRTLLRAVPNTLQNKALARGTQLHTYAEQLHTEGSINLEPGEQADMVVALADWLDAWQIEPVAVEVPLANTTKRWAGTCDLIARSKPLAKQLGLPDDALHLLDYKTNTKAIYGESAVQVAAYSHADICHIDGVEQPMPKISAAALVRVTPTGCELTVVKPDRMADLYRLFTAAHHIWTCTDQKRGWLHESTEGPYTTPTDMEQQ